MTSEWTCQDSDGSLLENEDGRMMRIQRSTNGEVVFTLSGRMSAEHVDELKALLESETAASRIVLDLRDLTLVNRDAVNFLKSYEGGSIEFRNCPAYIRDVDDARTGGRLAAKQDLGTQTRCGRIHAVPLHKYTQDEGGIRKDV
jgi:hypothetical protein